MCVCLSQTMRVCAVCVGGREGIIRHRFHLACLHYVVVSFVRWYHLVSAVVILCSLSCVPLLLTLCGCEACVPVSWLCVVLFSLCLRTNSVLLIDACFCVNSVLPIDAHLYMNFALHIDACYCARSLCCLWILVHGGCATLA